MSTFTPDAAPPLERQISLQAGGEDSTGACADCGGQLRRIWGYVVDGRETLAAYIVTWMPGRTDHDAGYDLVFERWDKAGGAQNRVAIGLDMRHGEDGRNGMRVVDAMGRLEAQPDLFDRHLTRVDVFASPRAGEVLAVAQAIYDNDPRLEEVRNWGHA